MSSRSWAPERLELMKVLWAQGLSAAQVAFQLGGTTRSAVMGQVHRLGLGRANPGKCRDHSGETMRKRIKEATMEAKERSEAIEKAAQAAKLEPPPIGPIGDFPHGPACRFIHGEIRGGAWRCCGAPVAKPGGSWCQHHLARMWQIGTKRKDLAA